VKPERSVIVHVALLLVAALSAFLVWTRKEPVVAGTVQKVQVWPGVPDEVERIEWAGKTKVSLEARKDKVGRYFVGALDKSVVVLKPGPDNSSDPDAGTGDSNKPKHETIRFVSVESAGKLAESLAPLKALRSLGKLEDSRFAEFGLKEPDGTLKVSIGGKLHTLVVGAATPGGADRYAREAETGLGYAVPGDLVRSLEFADSRLSERSLHHFEDKEITRARISKADRARELVSVEGKKNAWANPQTPSSQDETAGNWMSKLETLAISDFVEQPPKALAPDTLVVKVDYFRGTKPRGFLELYKTQGDDGKPDYLVRTEYLRWYGKLRRGSADQVQQDLPSVLK
jgi:hypothetical protein